MGTRVVASNQDNIAIPYASEDTYPRHLLDLCPNHSLSTISLVRL